MLLFDQPDFHTVSSREWIVTNGIGGYASSSLCGANTRRYHGLLVASFNPPTDRRVLVSKVEESVIFNENVIDISSNQYEGALHPKGYQLLKSFERKFFPCAVFSSDGFSVSKSVFMVHGFNTTVIEYHNTGSQPFDLLLHPLLVCRDYHHLFNADNVFDFSTADIPGGLMIIPKKDADPFYIFFNKGQYFPEGKWYYNFVYFREKERGLDFTEDCRSIGYIKNHLKPGEKINLILSTEKELPAGNPDLWKSFEEARLKSLSPDIENQFIRDLIISGDQFLVWRQSSSSHTLIAGYHWFTDWGRDTMIAMRGLIIATGRKQMAESILQTFVKYLDRGMIPNRFPDQGEDPEYNTIDASLWLFVALHDYYEKFKDKEFVKRLMPSLGSIIQAHSEGTRYNIHVTHEGLLYGGAADTQLTWMDAKVGDHVVTPRLGCAVEINALWYNVLSIYKSFLELLELPSDGWEEKIIHTGAAFRKYFINEKGYLFDIVIPGGIKDEAIRPNQVYAVSLPYSPLAQGDQMKVLETIEKHLYTPFGLRSLSPKHIDFKDIYKGNQWERDHAYHQGTVWAFLWGEYALAFLKVHGYTQEAKSIIWKKAKQLEHHFYHEDGICAISEIFDGSSPLQGKGCIQQAWSVGMLIKALMIAGVEHRA